MRSQLDNLKTLMNNSIYRNGLDHPKTVLIAARVDEEVTKVQKELSNYKREVKEERNEVVRASVNNRCDIHSIDDEEIKIERRKLRKNAEMAATLISYLVYQLTDEEVKKILNLKSLICKRILETEEGIYQ